jgi:nuclear transport factor 2 (NTF2) superfamily protein
MEQTSQDKTDVTKTTFEVVPPVSAPVDTRHEELEQAKKELAELKRKQLEAERKEQEAKTERLRKEREEIAKLKEEKASAQREELDRLRREKADRERQVEERIPKEKVISFTENGIDIRLTYPSHVRAGQKFRITADMTNRYARAKQGGLTLSFPDMRTLAGTSLRNSFSRIDGYSYPQKIWNKQARKALPANYFVVEGWQSRPWSYGKTKHFTVELTAPTNLSELRVNVRAVLWIKNKHNLKEIPLKSYVYDQQGFAVKQFSIKIK